MGFVFTNMSLRPEVWFTSTTGEGRRNSGSRKQVRTELGPPCPAIGSISNQMRLWLFSLAYDLGNFLRRLGLPKAIKDWSLRRDGALD